MQKRRLAAALLLTGGILSAHAATPAYPERPVRLIALNPPGGVSDTIARALGDADVVSVHVPLMPETRHLMTAATFAKMKRTAYLINTSRGPVVDEAALVAALEAKQIAGAGLDVYEREPEIHPGLVHRDDVVLAPHIASASVETRTKMAVMAASNVIALFDGQRPPNALNPEVL